jgi:GAF domain-containing protein
MQQNEEFLTNVTSKKTEESWQLCARELDSLLDQNEPLLTSLSNAAAFIYQALDSLNWAGFYFLKDKTLFLGPFIGKPACTVLVPGKGVCSASVEQRKTIVVPDVHAFPGHIACDADSRSEIVLPLILLNGECVGVLDLDSPMPDRFDELDREGLEMLRDIIVKKIGTRSLLHLLS